MQHFDAFAARSPRAPCCRCLAVSRLLQQHRQHLWLRRVLEVAAKPARRARLQGCLHRMHAPLPSDATHAQQRLAQRAAVVPAAMYS